MKEKPNITYIQDLAGSNENFKAKLIKILQNELPLEKETYLENFDTNNFEEAAQNVHKLKHKISILGLKKGYDLAEELEKSLNEQLPLNNLHKEFINLLQIMEDFVATL